MKKSIKRIFLLVLSLTIFIFTAFSVLAEDDSIFGTVENGIRSPRNNYMYSPGSKEYLPEPTNLDFSQGFKYWGSSNEGKCPSDMCTIEKVDGKTALKFTKIDKTWDGIACWPFMIESAQEGTNFAVVYDYKGDLAGYDIKLSGEGGWLSGTSATIVDYEDPEKWNTAVSRPQKSLPKLEDPASVYHFNLHIQYGGQKDDFAPCYFSNFRIVKYSSDKEIYDLSGKKLVFETPDLSLNGATTSDGYTDNNSSELDDGTSAAGADKSISDTKDDKTQAKENAGLPVWLTVLIVFAGTAVAVSIAFLVIFAVRKKKSAVETDYKNTEDSENAE